MPLIGWIIAMELEIRKSVVIHVFSSFIFIQILCQSPSSSYRKGRSLSCQYFILKNSLGPHMFQVKYWGLGNEVRSKAETLIIFKFFSNRYGDLGK
jgi:hypothetical protein